MDWLTGIQNAINYVEEHLTDDIDYEEVAKEAACSNFYFQRIFGILCGISLGKTEETYELREVSVDKIALTTIA